MISERGHELLALAPMALADVDEVYALEQNVFPHPWSRANFLDSLASGYDAWVLREEGGGLIGYFLLLVAVDEAHLLDVAVAAARQRAGRSRAGPVPYLLARPASLPPQAGMLSMLLEVRPSNLRALEVYKKYGFNEIGRRKGYYPAHEGQREDAIVMRFGL
jgi:ribosomal-protein-alanine N-acetyltransferase